MRSLGISINTFSGIHFADFTLLARHAEDAGFEGVFVTEGPNDVLMCCHAIAKATQRIGIASWIANIYYREPVLCAAAAQMVQEESDGRFILGLGVSHRPGLSGLKIEMGDARKRLRHYTQVIQRGLRGEPVSSLGMRLRPASIPIYFGTLTKQTAKLAGELADGIMLYLASPDRIKSEIELCRGEAARHGRNPYAIKTTVGLPAFVDADLARAREAARRSLYFFAGLPFYNRILARAGFEAEARALADALMRRDFPAAIASISDRLIDWLALAGPAERCIERIAQYRASGAELPIVVPNVVSGDYANTVRNAIAVFSRSI